MGAGRGQTHISQCCWWELPSLHSGQVTNGSPSLPFRTRLPKWASPPLPRGPMPAHSQGDLLPATQGAAGSGLDPGPGPVFGPCHSQPKPRIPRAALHPPHPTPSHPMQTFQTKAHTGSQHRPRTSSAHSSAAQPGSRTYCHETGATAKPGAGTPTQRVCPGWAGRRGSISIPAQGSLRNPAPGQGQGGTHTVPRPRSTTPTPRRPRPARPPEKGTHALLSPSLPRQGTHSKGSSGGGGGGRQA